MTIKDEPTPGSNAYARESANYYEHIASVGGDLGFGPTDLRLAAKWARYHASRWQRRAGIACMVAVVATLGVGLPDFNGDGRASLADLGAAMRQAAGTLMPSSVVNAAAAKADQGARRASSE